MVHRGECRAIASNDIRCFSMACQSGSVVELWSYTAGFSSCLPTPFSTVYFSVMGTYYGEQGWRSGGRPRLPPMCPGFDSWTRRHMWVEFVVGSLLAQRVFSGFSGFLPPQKPTLQILIQSHARTLYNEL